jgi:hypothetical protein
MTEPETVRSWEADLVLKLIADKRLDVRAELVGHTVAPDVDPDGAAVLVTRARLCISIWADGEKLSQSIHPDEMIPPGATVERRGIAKITRYADGRQDVKIGGANFVQGA